ncbi:MFS transporter [Paenibacillus hamazuiensis]|uniref:MFS transporter n=1 Tax=Paenibacillus hamazuiensis TaxID=2936508 RepID=UPI00200E633A|nr:MFS transporter [Paenibacillus hamazuiensis]
MARNYSLMTAVLCWSGLAVMSSLYVTIPLTALFAGHFGVTMTQAAAAGSVYSLGFAAGCLVYGAVSDKYGRRKVIVIGLIALTFVSLLLGTADSFSSIIALRCLQGAAAATFSPVALAYAVEMYPPEKRVTAIGFISTGFLVAGIVGQVVSSLISELYGWNAVFYLLAAVYAATVMLVLRLLPKGEIQNASARISEPLAQIGKVFGQKQLVFCYIVALVLLMTFVSMYTVLGSYLTGPEFGLNSRQVLYIRSAGVLGMLVSPFAGRLARRFGVRTVLRGGLLVAAASLAAMGVTPDLSFLVCVSLVFVAGIALSVPSLIALVGQWGGKARGIAVSVYTFILFAGTSVGPVLSVRLMQMGSYSLTFALLALILGAGLLAACLIRGDASEKTTAG